MPSEDSPPDDLRSLREQLRTQSDFVLQLTKIEARLYDIDGRMEAGFKDVTKRQDITNGQVATSRADINAINARHAADDLRQARADGMRDGQAMALITKGQWRAMVALVGLGATIGALVGAIISLAERGV